MTFADHHPAHLKREKDWNRYEFFSDFPPLLNLPLLFEQAGMNCDIGRWFLITLGVAGFSACAVWMASRQVLFATGAFLSALFAPHLCVLYARKKRIKAFESLLAQSLEIISRSLRAGQPFSLGMHMISTEMPPPIGMEFGRVFLEQQMGLPLEESLRQMARRVPLLDLRFFVLSILIHSQAGGDLAEILSNLSKVIRDRFKIMGQVKALTAEGRLSGWVLSLLPIFVFGMILGINPQYILLLLTTELGRKMLYFSVGMQIIGMFMIRKIVNIKV